MIEQDAPRQYRLGAPGMSDGEQIVIEGRIAGRAVSATWCDGSLIGDSVLIAAAQRVVASKVAVQDTDGKVTRASLRDMPGAAVALMRALDEIESVRISAPAERPSPSTLSGT